MPRCPSCGRKLPSKRNRELCADCIYKYGEVWVLDLERGQWTLEHRGPLSGRCARMPRSWRGRSTKNLPTELLAAGLYSHLKRVLKVTEETAVVLVAKGMTYEELCSIASEMAGH